MALLMLVFLLAAITPLLCASMEKHEFEAHELHQFESGNSSFMHLPAGFNLPFASFFNFTTDSPLSPDLVLPNIDNGLFFPILSSPSSHDSSSPIPGFSLGFYYTHDSVLYLAVCAGSLGRNISISPSFDPTITNKYPFKTAGGFTVPVWMANLHHPIQNASSASLVVVPADNSSNYTSALQLQLRDGNQVVWNLSNVGMMEMADSGDFRIYESISVSAASVDAPVFHQIPITDTLIEGQQLSVGMQLTSNDSAYSASMEKGGLALYLNSVSTETPYWIFPLFRDPDPKFANLSITQLVSSAPYCTNMSHPPYLHVSSADPTDPANDIQYVLLEPGSCSSAIGLYCRLYLVLDGFDISWSFLRLENDGRLYLYAVSNSSNTVLRHGLDSDEIFANVRAKNAPVNSFILTSGNPVFMGDVGSECDVPLVCGPLGVCIPGVKTTCSCPNELYFEPRDITDLTRGCKRRNSLPRCTASRGNVLMTNSTIFVDLNSTANIFLLNGRISNSTSDIHACKHACSLDCSCHGLSYQMNTNSCFLMKQEISLLHISDVSSFSWNYTATSAGSLVVETALHADDYVTHLKVALLPGDIGSPLKSVSSPFAMLTLIGIIPFSVLVCLLLGLGGCYWRKRRRQLRQQAQEEEGLRDILPLLPARFTFKELQEATEGFSKLLGAGGCGSVYAGTLLDGRKVAVKVLEGMFQGAHSQCKDFLAELATVGRTGHHNIVRLVGFCWQVSHRLLVYEYVERGSLDRWLFGTGDLLLSWEKRYIVVLGIARGLHYLHEQCEQPILHFDIKPQNILLNDAFVAKLADFGMSRLMQRDASSVRTRVRGTPGYIAPEWFSHGTVSKKSDIYSMGVVMLEIVAGRKVLDYSLIDSSQPDNVDSAAWHLPSWVAKRWEQGSLMDLVDKKLHVCGFDEVQVQRLLHIALWCINEDPSVRPQAATVVQWLESSVPIQQPPSFAPCNHL